MSKYGYFRVICEIYSFIAWLKGGLEVTYLRWLKGVGLKVVVHNVITYRIEGFYKFWGFFFIYNLTLL